MLLLKFFLLRNRTAYLLFLVLFLFLIELDDSKVLSSPIVLLSAAGHGEDQTTNHIECYDEENLTVALTHSRLQSSDSLLLLYSDGYLSSFNLTSGHLFWESDTFGDIVTVNVEKPPTEEMIQTDPFAQPFFLYGSGLYTVIPLRQCSDTSFTPGSISKGGDECATPFVSKGLQRRFFANISTLLRRRHFVVGDTDFFVSTDVSIFDIDSVTGKTHDSTSSVPFPQKYTFEIPAVLPRGSEGDDGNVFLPDVDERITSRHGSLPMTARLIGSTSPLSPYLHVVRHNIKLSAYRIGEYKWSITIAQLELSERHPYHVQKKEGGPLEGERNEKHPRFFSKLIERLLETSFFFSSDHKAANKTSVPIVVREINSSYVAAWSKTLQKDMWYIRVGSNRCDEISSLSRFPVTALCTGFPTKRVIAAYMWKEGDILRVPIVAREEDGAIAVVDFLEGQNSNDSERNMYRPRSPETFSSLPDFLSAQDLITGARMKYHPAELAVMLYTAGHYRTYLLPLYGNRDFDLEEEDYEDIFSHRDSKSLLRSLLQMCDIPFFLFHAIFFIAWCGFLKTGMQFRPKSDGEVLSRSKYFSSFTAPGYKDPFSSYPINETSVCTCDSGMPGSPLARLIAHRSTTLPAVKSSSSDISTTSYNKSAGLHQNSFLSTECNETSSNSPEDRTSPPPGGFRGDFFQQHFIIKEKIGFGGEGSIFLAEHKVTHMLYAIKAVKIRDRSEERALEEAMLHSTFDHPHVVRYHFCWIEDISSRQASKLQLFNDDDDGFDSMSMVDDDDEESRDTVETVDRGSFSWESSSGGSPEASFITSQGSRGIHRTLFILMEYFEHGTLADALNKRTSIDRVENLRYLQSIVMGLQYLHERNVMHRDLKPTNIFVTKDKILRIGDFGLAKRREPIANASDLAVVGITYGKEVSAQAGSPLYSSPEQLSNGEVSKLSDVFSLGLVMVELYSQFTTFHERIDVFSKARRGQLPPQFHTAYVEEGELILKMLRENPLDRPTAHETLLSISETLQVEERKTLS